MRYTTELEITLPFDCLMPERLIDETVKAIVVFGSDVIYSSKEFSNAFADTNGSM